METEVVSNTSSLSNNSSLSNSDSTTVSSSMWKYLFIVLILALFGFNLFKYAGDFSKLIGQIMDNIINIFKPILAYFGYGVTEAAKKTIDLTATGTTQVVNAAAGTLTGGINILQRGLTKNNDNTASNANTANNAINNATLQKTPMPDDAGSSTQASKANRKAGFCYIGEDRGFRSCISVGEGDTCMSGDIFPTQDLCINPNVRSG